MSVNESVTNKTSEDITTQGLVQELDRCRTKNAKLKQEKQLMAAALALKNKKGGRKRKTKKRRQKGGAEDLSFEKPMVSNVSSAGAIQSTIHKQKTGNAEVVKLNKEMAGGAVVVPQMSQAGASGNKSIAGSIGTTLQGRADAKYDKDVYNKPEPSGMPRGGAKKRRRKRKTKRKSRKSKRKRKRKTKRRRKRKTKKRRR